MPHQPMRTQENSMLWVYNLGLTRGNAKITGIDVVRLLEYRTLADEMRVRPYALRYAFHVQFGVAPNLQIFGSVHQVASELIERARPRKAPCQTHRGFCRERRRSQVAATISSKPRIRLRIECGPQAATKLQDPR